jgi:hypothetical protein
VEDRGFRAPQDVGPAAVQHDHDHVVGGPGGRGGGRAARAGGPGRDDDQSDSQTASKRHGENRTGSRSYHHATDTLEFSAMQKDPKDKPQPVPPDKEPRPPVEIPPDQPGLPADDPDPLPKGDPKPNEPTRLVRL